eukprot:Nk52_evm12s442 gene=Nk52_evmTU12s442
MSDSPRKTSRSGSKSPVKTNLPAPPLKGDENLHMVLGGSVTKTPASNDARRQLHNKFEKCRRDTIRKGYMAVVDVVPSADDKMSRSRILKFAIEHIHVLQDAEHVYKEVDKLRKENAHLKERVASMRK